MKKQAGRFARLIVAAGFLIVIVGFTGQDSSFPLGVYTITLAAEDFPSDFPGDPENLFGKYEVTFDKENRYRLIKDGEFADGGHYTSTAEQIVFTDDEGPMNCAQIGGWATGTYKWKLDGNKLTFKAVEDKCIGRKVGLTARQWEKKQ